MLRFSTALANRITHIFYHFGISPGQSVDKFTNKLFSKECFVSKFERKLVICQYFMHILTNEICLITQPDVLTNYRHHVQCLLIKLLGGKKMRVDISPRLIKLPRCFWLIVYILEVNSQFIHSEKKNM